MKKTVLIIVTVLLITSLINVLPVYAVSNIEPPSNYIPENIHMSYLSNALDPTTTHASSITEYDSFLVAYYDNLTYNFGVNYKNSCGYIALGMLLTYYDTYLNDNIIPEQYDISSVGEGTDMVTRRNSPGIYRDIIENPNAVYDNTLSYFSATDYYSVMESMSNSSLHAKLITIGASKGYYSFTNNSAPALINISNLKNVAIDFLNDVSEMQNGEYTIFSTYRGKNGTTSEDIKESTINSIQAGNPVLLLVGAPGTSVGHFVIAYDYNPDTKTVYCHLGYGADETHIDLNDTIFSEYWSMMTIDFNLESNPGYNYGVTTITNNIPQTQYYRYDNCDIKTYIDKEHNYTDEYLQYSNSQHKAYCECGDYIIQSHQFENGICAMCEFSHPHTFFYRWLSEIQHRKFCGCGYSIYASHVVSQDSTSGSIQDLTCLLCKGKVTIGAVGSNNINELPRTENGSYILPNGIIVLAQEDIEAYMSGELVFCDPNDDLVDS